MTVKELRKFLERFPDDMEVLNTRYSDYEIVKENDFWVVDAVDKGFYVMKAHETMSEKYKVKMKKYLHLRGN